MARVFVLDNSALLRKCLETLLVEKGHQAIVTSVGRIGLEHHEMKAADVVFLGRFLSDMTGEDYLRLARECGSKTPVVMIRSADAFADGTLFDGAELGVVGVVTTPFTEREVQDAIDYTLATRRRQVRVYGSDYVEPTYEPKPKKQKTADDEQSVA